MAKMLTKNLKHKVSLSLYAIGIKRPFIKSVNESCQLALSKLFVNVQTKTYWLEEVKGKIRFLLIVKIDVDESISKKIYQAIQEYVNQQISQLLSVPNKTLQITTVIYTKADRTKRRRTSDINVSKKLEGLSGNSSFPSFLDGGNTSGEAVSPDSGPEITVVEIEAQEFNQLFSIERETTKVE
jgi:hypothetical protein